VPYHPPNGTAGEWMEDPYGEVGYTYSGPGMYHTHNITETIILILQAFDYHSTLSPHGQEVDMSSPSMQITTLRLCLSVSF
jgi:hypothetical protein